MKKWTNERKMARTYNDLDDAFATRNTLRDADPSGVYEVKRAGRYEKTWVVERTRETRTAVVRDYLVATRTTAEPCHPDDGCPCCW